jgi:hypothetical protein
VDSAQYIVSGNRRFNYLCFVNKHKELVNVFSVELDHSLFISEKD